MLPSIYTPTNTKIKNILIRNNNIPKYYNRSLQQLVDACDRCNNVVVVITADEEHHAKQKKCLNILWQNVDCINYFNIFSIYKLISPYKGFPHNTLV